MRRQVSSANGGKQVSRGSGAKIAHAQDLGSEDSVFPPDMMLSDRWLVSVMITVGAHIANAIDRAARAMGKLEGIGRSPLTARQIEVIALRNQGLGISEVSHQLNVSEGRIRQIEAHLRSRHRPEKRTKG